MWAAELVTTNIVRDGQTLKLAEAMNTFKGSFETGVIRRKLQKPSRYELEVPYKGKALRGEELVQQLNKWAKYGTIEPSAAEAISVVAKNSEWADLSDTYFVTLGAGSAMGPYSVLMSLGANVIAIDLDREGIWKRLHVFRSSLFADVFSLEPVQNLWCMSD